MSVTRLITRELIKLNYQKLNYVFNCESKILNRCFHTGHSVSKVNFCPEGIIFRKYSTEIDALGVDDKKYNECNDEPGKGEEMKKRREKIFEEIANGDPEILNKLKLIEFEMAVLKQDGKQIVNNPSKSQWQELLKIYNSSRKYKLKILSFMALNEKLEFYREKKKSIKAMLRQKKKEAGFHYYGLTGQSIIPRPVDGGTNLHKMTAFRQITASNKIIIDCSYEELMDDLCLKYLARQIQMTVFDMQVHKYPCQLQFCNLNKNTNFGELIPKYVPNIFNDNFTYNVSDQDPWDIYPKEKLVYLSPHTMNNLIELNEDDIYIIGGYVDKGKSVKASLAKAKKEKLRVAKLPIDLYMLWRQGTKNLPINVVVQILLDMMFYKDWNSALKCISLRSINDICRRQNVDSSEECKEIRDLFTYNFD